MSDGALTFCCSGCRSVYEILRTHDLCAYYDLDAHPGTSMKGAGDEEFVALDDPAVVRLFVEFDSGRTRRLRFEIPSMHCASCVWLLEQLDRLDTGIQRSEVDLMRKSIRVDIDPTKTSARGVASLLTSLGYKPLIRVEGSTGASSALRTIYLRLGVAGFAMGNVMMFSIARYLAGPAGMSASLSTLFDILSVLLSIPVLVYSSAPWWQAAWGALRRRTINLEVPVALGIATLFVRSVTDIAMGQSEGFLDSFTGLVFFLLIGRLFQQKAFDAVSFDRTYRSFFPLSVRVERRNAEHVVSVDNVEVGDTMLVRNGEVIPCDAVLISPIGYVDYSFVTGESIPVECTEGALVYAGGRVVGGRVRLTATRTVSHGYLASLWDRAGGRKQRTTLLDLATTFGRVFTVAAVGIAVIGGLVWLPDLAMSLQVLTAVLIIACPCALTLSAPVTLGTAMAILGRRGTYVKNVGVLLDLASIDTVIIDKTGTLTAAHHDVAWNGADLAPSQRTCVVTLASHSTHPVSRSIAASMHGSMSMATHVEETAGQGIAGLVDGSLVRIGSAPYVGLEQTTMDAAAWVSIDGHVIGAFVLQPRLREGVTEMLRALMARMRVVLLSGDSERDRSLFAPFFAEHDMRFGATPHDKVEHVRALRSQGRHTVMIGDGLNDAAAMAEADAAIAVTDETATLVPACDVIMQAGQLVTLPSLIAYTRRVKQVIWWNLGISMAYNVLGLTLALMGVLSPVIVAVLMPVSSLTVIGVSVFGARWFGRRNAWA